LLISIIVAMAKNRAIGRDGRIPWQLPGELQRFKQLTTGHSLLMGRKTFASIGRALPGRTTYVLSRSAGFTVAGGQVFADLAAAVAAAEDAGETELFVCGGAEVYRQALPLCQQLYLTELEAEVAGDAFFPQLPTAQFQLIRRVTLVEEQVYSFSLFSHRPQL
jgi:dihydrofolate reductase